jgi:hypothetical protein
MTWGSRHGHEINARAHRAQQRLEVARELLRGHVPQVECRDRDLREPVDIEQRRSRGDRTDRGFVASHQHDPPRIVRDHDAGGRCKRRDERRELARRKMARRQNDDAAARRRGLARIDDAGLHRTALSRCAGDGDKVAAIDDRDAHGDKRRAERVDCCEPRLQVLDPQCHHAGHIWRDREVDLQKLAQDLIDDHVDVGADITAGEGLVGLEIDGRRCRLDA